MSLKKLFLAFLLSSVLFFMAVCTVVIMMISGDNEVGNEKIDEEYGEYVTSGITPDVERYRYLFEKYARINGVEKYVDVIMALVMQESGGRLLDIMQSSESIGLPPNTITDPEYSIEVGMKHFKSVLQKAHGDIKLTLQAYNYGGGFIDYVNQNGGKYTKELAVRFSRLMAMKYHWPSYGDPDYVDHVMRYLKRSTGSRFVNGSIKGFEAVMKEALKYKGWRYVWGGSTPKTGFDCSGLTQWSYKQAGIQLPRTAQEQYETTKRISEKEAKPGDLVFFGGTYSGKAITHVGIYVGDGRMYNSNDSGIGYSNLKSGYWREHLVGFGRIKL
ncbi:bifunctional lytic transglycosylase/C40 family peptidase [Bacillus licheniformis]|uniref:bifunctional lytic transglycosylase/C40 family peptidase n=1 Tax=Bacillus licheniformis TaxID=1402 RepID=UPI002DBB4526|nr:lysozyme family protein [Bacillus licheniformis]MEC0490197.1 lysozyme family protein [Bacillus licheniformis]